jgi:hypothetical protein
MPSYNISAKQMIEFSQNVARKMSTYQNFCQIPDIHRQIPRDDPRQHNNPNNAKTRWNVGGNTMTGTGVEGLMTATDDVQWGPVCIAINLMMLTRVDGLMTAIGDVRWGQVCAVINLMTVPRVEGLMMATNYKQWGQVCTAINLITATGVEGLMKATDDVRWG